MITIRLARAEEYHQVGELTVRAYADTGAIDAERDYVASLRDARGRARDSPLFVAELDGVLAGTVTWCPPGSSQREVARDGEGEFRMLAVAPQHGRAGIGAALVHHVIDLARAADLQALVLCSATTMTAAHRLYPRLGFVRLPDRDWTPAPEVDLLAYGRRLR